MNMKFLAAAMAVLATALPVTGQEPTGATFHYHTHRHLITRVSDEGVQAPYRVVVAAADTEDNVQSVVCNLEEAEHSAVRQRGRSANREREHIAFFSGFETGIHYDEFRGPQGPFKEDSWQSAQTWGPDKGESWQKGTAGVHVIDSPTRTQGGKALHIENREDWGFREPEQERFRNELRSPPARNFQYGDTYWHGISIMIPETEDNLLWLKTKWQNQMLFQWHYKHGLMGVHTYNRGFRLSAKYVPFDPDDDQLFFGKATPNVWHDFVAQIKLHEHDGFVRLWHQEDLGGYRQVIELAGKTGTPDEHLNPKIGMYRNKFGRITGEPYGRWDVYYDEIRVSEPNKGNFEDVAPGDEPVVVL